MYYKPEKLFLLALNKMRSNDFGQISGILDKNRDSGHCETESRGAQQQNRLLESSKILKEQSSKHFLEQTSCFYVCQMNNKHCYAQVCRLGINH